MIASIIIIIIIIVAVTTFANADHQHAVFPQACLELRAGHSASPAEADCLSIDQPPSTENGAQRAILTQNGGDTLLDLGIQRLFPYNLHSNSTQDLWGNPKGQSADKHIAICHLQNLQHI